MKCPNCGHTNRDVARFCQHCGALLSAGQGAGDEDALPGDQPATGADQAATADETATSPTGEAEAEGPEPEPGQAVARPEEEEAVAAAASPAESLAPDQGWAELPVDEAQQTPPQPIDPPAALEDETVAPSEHAAPPVEAGEAQGPPPVDERALEDKRALEDERAFEDRRALGDDPSLRDEAGPAEGVRAVPGEEALDQAEAQERLVPLVGDEGEAAPPPEDVLAAEAELRGADVLPWRDEPLPADVLEPGDVIDGRYRVVEIRAIDEIDVLYSARDLQRCPQCGFDANSPDQAFCTACGAVMDHKPMVSMLQRPAGGEGMPDVVLLDHVVEGERAYWVWEESGKQTDVLGGSEEPMRMVIGQRTHPGRARELDEDSLFALTMSYTYESIERASGLFIVADGLGGHEAGELASRIGIRTLAGIVLHHVFARELAGDEIDEDAVLAALERAMQSANEQVFLERERRENDMGTTITAALLREWTLYLAHVGDCRAYRWGEDGLQQLTTDHSVIASMVASGAAQPGDVYTHPHRSVIYRCVGDQPHVAVDTAVLSIEPGDRLLICCDGLWEMLREDGIEEVLLREADPQRACDAMVDAANEAGGPDNISVIVVQV